ncbi:MAG: translation initiation factor IF-3, partial [Deltaproteobacteria bacterium]|nr:translation initiation factor IF-3 [Deltaproteobacteria bacterium]
MTAIQKQRVRINEQIKVPEIRLIGADGAQVGVMPVKEALAMAAEANLDLVEVAPQANPPVCRIMDYGKYKYQQSKKQQEARRRQTTIQVKEIKVRPKIEVHDMAFKMKNARRFLGEGDKVKISVIFRGREIAHTDRGFRLLAQIS